MITFDLRVQIKRRRLQFWESLAPQIAHLDVKARVQVGDRSLRIELDVQDPGRQRLRTDVLEKLFYVEVLGLKVRYDFSVGGAYRCTRAEISPHEWDGSVAGRKFRGPLIELNLANLQRFALGLGDCLKIHLVAGEKNDGHIETIGRIGRVDIGPKRLQAAVTPFLESELQLPGIFECLRIAASFPVEGKRAGQFVLIAKGPKHRLKRR